MSRIFGNFNDIQKHLDSLGLFHMDMGLSRVRRAMAALGLTRPPFRVVQILGTNGKGSTAAFLASLCTAHGCKTGLYTSPHFVSPEERIRIDGTPWPGARWPEPANAVMAAAPDLTYFEFLTVLALLVFAREKAEVAILEAGLGGRYDATTAVDADMLCFTPMAMDHKDVLGPTLTHIATDKAGAVRGPAPICSAAQFPEAARCLALAAQTHGAPLIWSEALPTAARRDPHADFRLGLSGPHQCANAGLALTAWRHLATLLDKAPADSAVQSRALSRAFVPGRLQAVPGTKDYPPLLLDGAHNPHGMAALVRALRAADIRPAGAVFSCLGDKDWRPAAMQLKRALGAAPILIPAMHNPRAALAEDLALACNALPPARAVPFADLPAALNQARQIAGTGPQRPVLLTGSLYLLAEFFTIYPHLLAPAPMPEN